MAKGGLSKLKCMIKRWHSSSRISRTPSGCSARSHDDAGAGAGFALEESWRRGVAPSSLVAIGGCGGRGLVSFHGADGVPPGLHSVYVGKSRRRYLITPLGRRQRGELGRRAAPTGPAAARRASGGGRVSGGGARAELGSHSSGEPPP
ncbi:hypothetical protein BAE44_0007472 [Dichanthelium oligosanthes]|uniref:Uncharacterized protein n=1 Tax=Dichanthelium oligosanthes TaxID=888268 RepID=A0A1E5W2A3_9POAL|nr:hypothetical protein BAE44_0007472 [Dichanthelium oligosanthes]